MSAPDEAERAKRLWTAPARRIPAEPGVEPASRMTASQIIADHVLGIADHAERLAMAKQLASYSIAAVIALEGPKAGAEFAYRAADAAASEVIA